jgi:hypothetical protein
MDFLIATAGAGLSGAGVVSLVDKAFKAVCVSTISLGTSLADIALPLTEALTIVAVNCSKSAIRVGKVSVNPKPSISYDISLDLLYSPRR